MENLSSIEVLIVGAGPTGLILAYQLQRLGVRFRIIDKNVTPSTTSKAIGLQYRMSELLTWMGLFERFRAKGLLGTGINFYVNGERILNLKLGHISGANGAGAFAPETIMISQSVTETLLIDALREREVTVERGLSFVEYTQDSEQVVSRIHHADGQEELIESRYLVSCEGAHSLIRKQAGIAFAGKAYPFAVFMADVQLDWQASHNEVHVWMHEDGMFSAIPLPGERRWRLFVEIGKQAEASATEVTLDLIRRLMADRTGDHTTQVSDPLWMSEFRISCRMVDRFRQGRIFLAGDAAHIHSPTGGQGITTGAQDVYNLAWKLGRVLRGEASDTLLDTYGEERLPVVRQVLATTNQNTTVFLARSRAGRLFRDRVFLPLLRRRVVQQRLASRLSQLAMNYRGASLSAHQETGLLRRTRVRAGDRTPDVVFRDARTGASTTLFAYLGHSRLLALMGFDRSVLPTQREQLKQSLDQLGIETVQVLPTASPSGSDGWIDDSGDFGRLYGAYGSFLYLVRPDGYVGLFQRPIDQGALQAYLAKLFAPDRVARAFGTQQSRALNAVLE